MLGRRVVIPLAVAGAMAVGAVAGAVLGVPGLSGASTTNVIQTAGSSVPGSGKATRPAVRAPRSRPRRRRST